MRVQDVRDSMINLTPTPRRRVLVPLKAFVVQVASACLVGTATRQSPKAAPALALVAAAAVAPVPSVRADHGISHSGCTTCSGPWSVTCGGCTFSGNYAGAPLARTVSCGTDCTSLVLEYRAITSMPGDPFADMGALRTLDLNGNDLSSLETGVFDALTALRYVGAGESARVGSCGDGCRRHAYARAPADIRHGHVHVWVDVRGRGARARGSPHPDGVMIVCPGTSPCGATT